MIRSEPHERWLATALAMLAGYVDAVGFLALGGFFVSFMSGNSTRAGVGLALDPSAAIEAVEIIAVFVTGVVVGTVVRRRARRPRATVIAMVSATLALAAALGAGDDLRLVAVTMAFAMGLENTVFERDGEVSISLTYMTGTLVRFGQRLAGAILGGDRVAWRPYLLLWTGLVAGASAGATAHQRLGLGAVWIAAAVAGALALVAARREE
ncbi:MAG: YoaK family protein [Polyangiales bacterium]